MFFCLGEEKGESKAPGRRGEVFFFFFSGPKFPPRNVLGIWFIVAVTKAGLPETSFK